MPLRWSLVVPPFEVGAMAAITARTGCGKSVSVDESVTGRHSPWVPRLRGEHFGWRSTMCSTCAPLTDRPPSTAVLLGPVARPVPVALIAGAELSDLGLEGDASVDLVLCSAGDVDCPGRCWCPAPQRGGPWT